MIQTYIYLPVDADFSSRHLASYYIHIVESNKILINIDNYDQYHYQKRCQVYTDLYHCV